MFKNRALFVDNPLVNLRINQRFYPTDVFNNNLMFITVGFTQLYKPTSRVFINIKNSLNTPINNCLSTVSTYTTIGTTKLNFNEIVINKEFGITK